MPDLSGLKAAADDDRQIIAAIGAGALTSYGDLNLPVPTASLVKLVIALQVWDSGLVVRRERDRRLIDAMLRCSDDDAANELWDSYGQTAIVSEQAARLGLSGTAPPEPAGMWGWATMSARDLIATMRHIVTLPDAAQRSAFTSALAQCEPRGADGFDQSFGLFHPGGAAVPVKQGWMTIDTRRYLHSVAALADGRIAVALTVTAPGASWADARDLVDAVAHALLSG